MSCITNIILFYCCCCCFVVVVAIIAVTVIMVAVFVADVALVYLIAVISIYIHVIVMYVDSFVTDHKMETSKSESEEDEATFLKEREKTAMVFFSPRYSFFFPFFLSLPAFLLNSLTSGRDSHLFIVFLSNNVLISGC